MDMKKSNKKSQIPNLFESLKLRIWILFVIYYLVLGILAIKVATILRYPFPFSYKANAI